MKSRSILAIIPLYAVILISMGMTAEAQKPVEVKKTREWPSALKTEQKRRIKKNFRVNEETDSTQYSQIPVCSEDICPKAEMENGECTAIRDRFGTPTGYIVSNTFFEYNDTDEITNCGYEICKKKGYSPRAISHVDLELPNCIDEGNEKTRCKVIDAPHDFEVFKDGRGDPSTGYLMWFVSDLIKIDEDQDDTADFFVKVEGEAYKTMGNVGLKIGKSMHVGEITVPVCSIDCSLSTFAASAGEAPDGEKNVVETKNGYKFAIQCDADGCCQVLPDGCYRPDSGWGSCEAKTFEEFFKTQKDGQSNIVEKISDGESKCINLVVDDNGEQSPSYCSGGWCWY